MATRIDVIRNGRRDARYKGERTEDVIAAIVKAENLDTNRILKQLKKHK
ncbi:hypothetical protein [Methanocella sp. MCL-LM]